MLPHTVIEAHLDCERVDRAFADWLITWGFLPDPFLEFFPKCYPDHFTRKQFVPNGQTGSVRMTRTHMAIACQIVANQLVSRGIAGYIELEVYPSASRLVLPSLRIPTNDDLTAFPLSAGSLKPLLTNHHKRADIHVKTPPSVPGLDPLRDQLLASGFYRVVTASGNIIFTAQFLEHTEARVVYQLLADYFRDYGGIKDVVLETCVDFWMTPRAELPSVVEYSPHVATS